MGAQNLFKGKAFEGTFAGGQGPVKGQEVTRESENDGLLSPSMGKLKTTGGSGEALVGTPADKNFDLESKSYAGTGNIEFKPKDMGEASNQP